MSTTSTVYPASARSLASLRVVAPVAVATAILGIQLARVWGFVIDDSYISYIYAHNLAHGHGLVYNPGEAVEGYSNFLWTVILAAGVFLGLEITAFSTAVGAVLALATLAVTWRLAQRLSLRQESSSPWIAPVLLALSTPFIMWSVSGLESALMTCCLTTATWLTLAERDRPALWPLMTLVLVALAMTRIEGVAYAGLLLTYGLVCDFRKGRLVQRAWLGKIGLFTVPLLAWHLWRISYYGWPLPNTYYAKMGGSSTLMDGVRYHYHFALDNFGNIGIFMAIALLTVAGWLLALRQRKLSHAHTLVLAVAALHTAIVLYSGGDWMPFNRLIVPILPIAYVLLMVGYEGFAGSPWSHRHTLALRVLGAGLAVVFVWQSLQATSDAIPTAERLTQETNDFKVAGQYLRETYPEDTTVAAINAGAMMFEAGLPFIDLVGLVDEEVAHDPMPARRDGKFASLEYLVEREPGVIIFFTLGPPEGGCCSTWVGGPGPAMQAIAESDYFRANYSYVRAFPFTEIDGSTSSLLLYERTAHSLIRH